MSAYDQLLSALCEQAGQDPTGLDGGVLKIEINGREAAVLPALLPSGAEAAEVVVSVCGFEAGDAWDEVEVLSLLHRVNAAAWPRHGWLASVDDEHEVVIRYLLPLEGISLAEWEPLVAEGLDRAASLQGLLQELSDAPADQAPGFASELPASMIKG